MTKTERALRQQVKELGGKLVQLTQKKHYKAVVERSDGSQFTTTFAVSGSDGARGDKNQIAMLRKLMEVRDEA